MHCLQSFIRGRFHFGIRISVCILVSFAGAGRPGERLFVTGMEGAGIERVCRTCMSESSLTMVPLFEESAAAANDESSISGMLRLFTSIKATPDDGLPQRVCLPCMREINQAVAFKHKCERAERTLKSFRSQMIRKEDQQPHLETLTETGGVFDKDDDPEDKGIGINASITDLEVVMEYAIPSTIYQCSNCPQTFASEDETHAHYNAEHVVKTTHVIDEKPPSVDKDIVADDAEEIEYMEEDVLSDSAQVDDEDDFEPQPVDDDEVEYESQPAADDENEYGSQPAAADDDEEYEPEPTVDDEDDYEPHPAEHIDDMDDDELSPLDGDEPPEKRSTNTDAFKCPKCSAGFVTKISLRIHSKSGRCTEPTFECDICGRVFMHADSLAAHRHDEHSAAVDRLTCPDCARRYRTEAELAQHRIDRPSCGKASNACPHCNRRFRIRSTLRNHLRTHTGERPFLCSECGKGFTQKSNMRQHMLRHAQLKEFQCTVCPKSFVSKGELVQHMYMHTGEQPFACEQCPAAFTSSSSLVKHRRIHTSERPYKCEHCPLRFAALGTLKNHRRTHTGEKPFRCDHCSRTFAQHSDCQMHMKLHNEDTRLQCHGCQKVFARLASLKTHQCQKRDASSEGDRLSEKTYDLQVLDE